MLKFFLEVRYRFWLLNKARTENLLKFTALVYMWNGKFDREFMDEFPGLGTMPKKFAELLVPVNNLIIL